MVLGVVSWSYERCRGARRGYGAMEGGVDSRIM